MVLVRNSQASLRNRCLSGSVNVHRIKKAGALQLSQALFKYDKKGGQLELGLCRDRKARSMWQRLIASSSIQN